MNGVYQYCLLRYIHSQFLGEEVNVGIVFYFPDEDRVIFKYPESQERLKHLYIDFPEQLIKSYLSSFSDSAERCSNTTNPAKVRNLESILPEYFIVPDGSALFFDKVNTGVKYEGANIIADDLFSRYFKDALHYQGS